MFANTDNTIKKVKNDPLSMAAASQNPPSKTSMFSMMGTSQKPPSKTSMFSVMSAPNQQV